MESNTLHLEIAVEQGVKELVCTVLEMCYGENWREYR